MRVPSTAPTRPCSRRPAVLVFAAGLTEPRHPDGYFLTLGVASGAAGSRNWTPKQGLCGSRWGWRAVGVKWRRDPSRAWRAGRGAAGWQLCMSRSITSGSFSTAPAASGTVSGIFAAAARGLGRGDVPGVGLAAAPLGWGLRSQTAPHWGGGFPSLGLGVLDRQGVPVLWDPLFSAANAAVPEQRRPRRRRFCVIFAEKGFICWFAVGSSDGQAASSRSRGARDRPEKVVFVLTPSPGVKTEAPHGAHRGSRGGPGHSQCVRC